MPLSWCLVKHRTKCTFILSGHDCQPVFKLRCIWFKFWMTQHNHLGCDLLQFGRYISVLLWNLLPSSSGYKETQTTGSYKMFVPIYQTTQSDNSFANSHSCMRGLHCISWLNHRFVCYKSCFIKVSACACRHAHTQNIPQVHVYTETNNFSHKWYVLKIKN